MIDFNPSVGEEIAKVRPAVVVSNDLIAGLKLKIVVPLTANSNPREWHVRIQPSVANGLKKQSLADCNQMKSVSEDRFKKKIGTLTGADMDQVKWALAKVLDLI